jgi:hypothetical protein
MTEQNEQTERMETMKIKIVRELGISEKECLKSCNGWRVWGVGKISYLPTIAGHWVHERHTADKKWVVENKRGRRVRYGSLDSAVNALRKLKTT